METVKTATGKLFNVSHCGSMNDYLYITFVGNTIVDIANVFSFPYETQRIEHYLEEELRETFVGYVVLTDISALDNEIRITLKIPEKE